MENGVNFIFSLLKQKIEELIDSVLAETFKEDL